MANLSEARTLLLSTDSLQQEMGFQQLRPHAADMVDELLNWLETETNQGVREYLVALLAESKSPKARPILLKLLDDPNPQINFWAAYGLGVRPTYKQPVRAENVPLASETTPPHSGLGVLDGQANAYFKEKDGVHYFFPWGFLGKGYQLPDVEAKQRLLKIMRRVSALGLVFVFVFNFGVSFIDGFLNKLFVIGITILIVFIAQWLYNRHLIQGLHVTAEKLTYTESARQLAKSYDGIVLGWGIFASVMAILFAGIGLLIVLTNGYPFYWVGIQIAGLVFFGIVLMMGIYLIKLKDEP